MNGLLVFRPVHERIAMKKVLPFFAACTLFLTSTAHAQTAPRKLALLVGISNYEKGRSAPPSWWSLNCKPDIEAMRQVLMTRFGFADKDIHVLTDAQATRAGIIAAFTSHLINQAKPGDIVEFHYSGHGQQVKDDNGDELDGLDESLIPYDYISQSAADGAKTNLRDDTLGELLSKLKTKMQGPDGKVLGNITMTFDCCFSGTETRGAPPAGRLKERGRGWNEALDGPRPAISTRGGAPESESGLFTPDAALAQGYIVMSATQSDQTAKEAEDERGTAMGAFTLFLTQEMNKATPGATYRDIFEKIAFDLRGAVNDQDPSIEGDINKQLFNNATLPSPPYFLVQAANSQQVQLPLGSLQGATIGSKFDLYKAGTSVTEPQNKIAEAQIKSLDFTSSIAVLGDAYRGKFQAQQLLAARAVETAHAFGANKLKVLLPQGEAWSEPLRQLDVVTTDGATEDNYDVAISRHDNELVLQRKDGTTLSTLPTDDKAASAVKDALLGEWRWQFLGKLKNDDPDAAMKVDLRVVPVEVQTDERGRVQKVLGDSKMEAPKDGIWRLADGTYVMIELKNESRLPAYVTVLDLSPDGSISPIFPHPDAPGVQENRIPADNAWHRIWGPQERPFVFRLGAPYGNEIFKVIATREQADFSPLLYEKIVTQRGGDNLLASLDPASQPLGQLLLSATTGQSTRGASFSGVPPTYWNTSEAMFTVKPLE
jgi:hypothetical protein